MSHQLRRPQVAAAAQKLMQIHASYSAGMTIGTNCGQAKVTGAGQQLAWLAPTGRHYLSQTDQ